MRKEKIFSFIRYLRKWREEKNTKSPLEAKRLENIYTKIKKQNN